MRYQPIFNIVLLATLLVTPSIWAEDPAPTIPATPQRLEASTPAAPMDMRAEDAEKLIKQVKGKASKLAPSSVSDAIGEQVSLLAEGVSHTIKVKAPKVVNKSPNFQFSDVTERSKPVSSIRSMSDRRAAVEAYRQSRIKQSQ